MLKNCLDNWDDLCCFMFPNIKHFFLHQPSYYLTQIKVTICETDSIMTHICKLCQSGFTFSSRRLIIMLSTICFFCIYVDQMIIHQRFNVAIFSLMFTPLFWKVFIDILMIYELPKVHKKITKYSENTCLNKVVPRESFLVASDIVTTLYNKSCTCTGD